MTSLTEVYQGGNGAGLRRLYAGVALFGVGAVLLVAGIVVAATEFHQMLGLGRFEAREVAGVLGGVGLPTLLVGTMTVLPRADRLVRLGAAVGAAVCLAGVYLFHQTYPVDWVGGSGDTSMTLVVAAVYFVGAILTSWCLFTSVASFKARNDPGGTVKLEITKGGETRIVEVSNDSLRTELGGVGLLGATPDGEVETQTNRPQQSGGATGSTSSSGASSRKTGEWPSAESAGRNSTAGSSGSSGRRSQGSGTGDGVGSGPGVTDGGSAADDAFRSPSDDAELVGQPSTAPDASMSAPAYGDAYCGNCTHFQYVRTDDGITPYCGYRGEAMDDMDACDHWTSNT